jgi:hypothetical protein
MRKLERIFGLLMLATIAAILLSACGAEAPLEESGETAELGTAVKALSAGHPAEGVMPHWAMSVRWSLKRTPS